MTDTPIKDFHAHVYFDASSLERARALCEEAARRVGAQNGRVHARPVGPPPAGRCQLAFDNAAFATLVPWLALNRDGLVIFVHPNTGDDLRDHRDHGLWMGEVRPLDLSQFTG